MPPNVTYACGHEGPLHLFGRGKMREQQMQWARTKGKCPGCRMKELGAEPLPQAVVSGDSSSAPQQAPAKCPRENTLSDAALLARRRVLAAKRAAVRTRSRAPRKIPSI